MVLNASDVKRWVQPAPTTTTGLAEAFIDATAPMRVQGLAVAPIPLAPTFPTRVPQTGVGSVVPDGVVFLLPSMLASATAAIEASGTFVSNVFIPNAEALAPITTSNVVTMVETGSAYLLMLAADPAVPVVAGYAEIGFDDFGGGNVPIFPVKFPWHFTDNPENIQDAAAELAFDGVGILDAVAGYADSTVAILTPGDAIKPSAILEFPLTFPYQFNDGSFSIKRGYATVDMLAVGDAVTAVDGIAEAAIDATGLRTNAARFPLVFPVQLQEFVALAAITVADSSDVRAVVEGEGAVDIYTVFQVELGE